jgi:hypothetical protein
MSDPFPRLYDIAGYHRARKAGPCTCTDTETGNAEFRVPECLEEILRGDDYITGPGMFPERWCLPCGIAHYGADEEWIEARDRKMRDAINRIGSHLDPGR